MNSLTTTTIRDYTTSQGAHYEKLDISFQVFGRPINTAPIVVVFHALTGNSDVCSLEKGWFRDIIGDQKVINLRHFTVIAFNILGNGYDGILIEKYQDFVAKDFALLSHQTLIKHSISSIHSVMGGSLGGGIAWEFISLFPNFSKQLVAIGCHWQSSDWIKGICGTQEEILLNSSKPLADARKMAMLFYRSPKSLNQRFNNELQNEHLYKVNSWLNHHGKKLENRFSIKAYLMMNHLLSRIQCRLPLKELTSIDIVQIGISSDILFPVEDILETKKRLDHFGISNHYYEINSIDGHDAFLIEHEQLSQFLKRHF